MTLFDDVPDDELNLNQLIELERSDDPADKERAGRLNARAGKAMRGLAKLPKFDFGFARLQTFEGVADRWRLQQEEADRAMRDVVEAAERRHARQAQAEDATIESAQLLDSMVSLAQAQSTQLALASTLLEALATQAAASSEAEEQRWRRGWPVMLWTLIAGAIAALAAVGAIVVTLIVAR